MKQTKWFLLFISFLVALPTGLFAYTGQYPWDPLYVAPTQQTTNSQTEQRLKGQYGVSAYYDCYPCTYTDTSFPSTQATCLLQTETCLERKATTSKTQCSTGTVYFNGRCVTYDAGCKELNGEGSYYTGNRNSDGKFLCDCRTGYKWSSANTCEKVTVTPTATSTATSSTTSCSAGHFYISKKSGCGTPVEYCMMTYGSGVYYTGILDSNENPSCDCLDGFAWNNARSACEVNATATSGIPEGAIIKTENNPNVYIIKYVGTKRFRRLILSPSVFTSYGHLKWENIITVGQEMMNSYAESNLVKVAVDDIVYQLSPQGDTGEKHPIRSMDALSRLGLDADSIYEINSFDRDSYVNGSEIN